MDVSFTNLFLVFVVAFATPLVLGFFPRVRIPSVVVEVLMGVILGPAVLDVIHLDDVVTLMATLGVAFLLFLAGLELDFAAMKGETFRLAARGFVFSFALALAVGVGLGAYGLILTPLLIAIVLSATSLGVVIPILKDANELDTPMGRLVVTNSSISEFATVALLSIFYSLEGGGLALHVGLLIVLSTAAVMLLWVLGRAFEVMPLVGVVNKLRSTTAQIRVRAAVLIMLGAVVLASHFGFEAILGAFMAGAVLSLLHHGWEEDPEVFRVKFDAIGFGFFVPVFFVASGIAFDLDALLASPAALLRVPLFLGALLLIRGLPALLYRKRVGNLWVPAALLQATSLSFIIVAVSVGVQVGKMRPENGAALVAAGLLSLLIFPATALSRLTRAAVPPAADP